MQNSITKIVSSKPGPTVAIIAGVHGNEHTGVLALKKLLPTLKLTRGTLYLIIANPPALRKDVRQINKNLNRCFFTGNNGTSYEDTRARQIMKILDQCEASLDLHAFNEPTGEPFVMAEQLGIKVAKIFDVSVISTGWADEEPGTTDGYMYVNSKVGLCLECGPIPQAKQFQSFAKKSIKQFLSYYNLLEHTIAPSSSAKRIITATSSLVRTSADFWVDPSLKSFDKLTAGQTFARHNHRDFVAKNGDFIIFPRPVAPIGAEAFIIGRDV